MLKKKMGARFLIAEKGEYGKGENYNKICCIRIETKIPTGTLMVFNINRYIKKYICKCVYPYIYIPLSWFLKTILHQKEPSL